MKSWWNSWKGKIIIIDNDRFKHGDLSKPSSGPRGRHYTNMKWTELSQKLNSEGTGDSRTEEKWRKVWSDFKNNSKKRAKINRAATGTGGGPALQLSLTDVELRVLQIIGVQAATGMAVEEAGFQEFQDDNSNMQSLLQDTVTVEWNMPGPSSQATVSSPPIHVAVEAPPSPAEVHPSEQEEAWRPAQKKRKGDDSVAQMFVEAERSARENAREHEIAFERLENERLKIETERLRQQDYEIRERVRLREQELLLQAQWLENMREAMKVFIRYFERG